MKYLRYHARPPQKRRVVSETDGGSTVRWISVMSAAMIAQATALPGQVETSGDSAGLARALVAYAVAHPMGAGSSHGAMSGLSIDSAASGWGEVMGRALRQIAPSQWLDHSSAQARTQPRLRVRSVVAGTDSAVVEAIWNWCYPEGGGESGWPVRYVLNHHATDWHVMSARNALVAHGRQCSFDSGRAR